MYPGNAPFPMSFGIPDTEPLSYQASSLATYTNTSNEASTSEQINYYHQRPARDLEFTVDSPRLTLKQRQFYEKNGFIVIPGLVPEDLLDHCHQRFLDIVDGKVAKGKIIRLLVA